MVWAIGSSEEKSFPRRHSMFHKLTEQLAESNQDLASDVNVKGGIFSRPLNFS